MLICVSLTAPIRTIEIEIKLRIQALALFARAPS